MIILGLTGSIGMGKSTTAALFAKRGIPVFDADQAVHALYHEPDVVRKVEALFPGAVKAGVVDRDALAKAVFGDPDRLRALELLVHPRSHALEKSFIEKARADGKHLVLLDIPLLFEAGREAEVDKVIVVSASPEEQRRRALARPGMTEERLKAILGRQMPDAEKRRRADYVIETDHGFEVAEAAVEALLATLKDGMTSA